METQTPLTAFSAMDIHSRVTETVQDPISRDAKIERILSAQSMLIYQLQEQQEKMEQNGQTVAVVTETRHKAMFGNTFSTTDFQGEPRNLKEKAITDFLDSDEGQIMTLELARELILDERKQLESAQTIFVSEEIVDEVIEATKTMPDNVLIPQDVFVPNGIIVFEKPLEYEIHVQGDLFAESWTIKSIQFNIDGSRGINVRAYGTWVSTRSIITNEKVYFNHETKSFDFENVADPEYLYQRMFGKGSDTKMNAEMLARKALTNNSLVDFTFFAFNSDKDVVEALTTLKRQLIALFRMTYSYLDVENHKPPRHFVKRAKRAKRDIPEDFYISVLTLRHKNYEGGSGIKNASPRFAFRVRGHWAKRYLRSTGLPVGDPKAYRFVYISDYVKGKDKKFVESKRVVAIKD